jgi:hypothetical protein
MAKRIEPEVYAVRCRHKQNRYLNCILYNCHPKVLTSVSGRAYEVFSRYIVLNGSTLDQPDLETPTRSSVRYRPIETRQGSAYKDANDGRYLFRWIMFVVVGCP